MLVTVVYVDKNVWVLMYTVHAFPLKCTSQRQTRLRSLVKPVLCVFMLTEMDRTEETGRKQLCYCH